MRYLLVISLSLLALKFKAQAYPDILESDSLPARVIFYLPTADNDKLNLIKNELIKYPQIQSAVYYYGSHKALLIEFADVVSPRFFTYADIKKQIAHGISVDEIYMKTPSVYELIENESSLDNIKYILK